MRQDIPGQSGDKETSVEAAQYKTKLEQRYFWLGVCDAQVEKNNREDESE